MPAGKPYHHGDLRSALLKASLELIAAAGAREFTLREVARRAGVSHAAPYRHFRDKDELLAALAADGFDSLTAAIRSAAAREPSEFARLLHAGIAYIHFAQDEPERFSIMFSADLDPARHPATRTAAARCFAELVALVAACRPARPAVPSTDIAARIAWAQVHGIADLTLRGQLTFKSRRELTEFATAAIDAIGQGLHLAPRRH